MSPYLYSLKTDDTHTHTPVYKHTSLRTHQLLQSWSLGGSKVSWRALSFQETAPLISLAELNVSEKKENTVFRETLDGGEMAGK